MRLQPQQLKQHLEHGLKSLYVLTGDEPLSMRECLDELRQAARNGGVDERTSLSVDRYFNWQKISAFGQSLSLFASSRLLEINIPNGKPGVEGGKALQALIEKPMADTVVIVILPKIDWKDQKNAWYVRLEQSSIFMVLQEIEAQQLPQWIAKRMELQNQQTDAATLEFIAHQVEGNLLAAHQEILKLGLLYPEGHLTGEAVRAAVLNVSRYDAFQLGEAVLAGDSERTVRIMQGLQDEGAEPVAVMGPLMWLLRPLVRIKQAEVRGENVSTVMQEARIFGDRQTLMKHAAARLSIRQLQAALLKLAEIDKTAKGLLKGDAWLEISRLCFGLARIGHRVKTR